MKRQLVVTAATLACLFAVRVGSASAQYYQYPTMPGYSTPYGNSSALSPYLNLLRGGDPSANYFLGVVPEFQRRANFNYLQTKIQEVEQEANAPLSEGTDLFKPLNATGHATAFNYYSSYFPQPGRPGAGPLGAAGQRR